MPLVGESDLLACLTPKYRPLLRPDRYSVVSAVSSTAAGMRRTCPAKTTAGREKSAGPVPDGITVPFQIVGRRAQARRNSHALMLEFNSRALESVRNTKGKLMPCLEIHSRQDGVRHLGDTEVDGKPGRLHAPTVKR